MVHFAEARTRQERGTEVMYMKSFAKKNPRSWLKGSFAALIAAAGIALVTPAQAGDTIKIGFSMALTGGLAGAGKGALIAMQVWAEDVNARGGILGKPVELVYYDDQTNPATVPAIYTKLLDIDEVDFVVSGYGTNLIAPAMPIVMQRGLVFPSLFGLAVNEKFNYDNYFQIMPAGPSPMTDWSKGFFEVAMAQDPPPRTIALVGADAEFARNAVKGARENAKDLGLEVVYDESYPPRTADYTPIVNANPGAQSGHRVRRILSARFGRHGEGGDRGRAQRQDVRGRHGRAAVRIDHDRARAEAERHRELRFLGAGADPQVRRRRGIPRQVPGSGPRARASIPWATTCNPMPTPTCRSWSRRLPPPTAWTTP